jgi:prophage regulatory protein
MRTQSIQSKSLPETAGTHHLPFVYFPIKAVCEAVGLSTSRIYDLIRRGEFPAGDLIGAQSRRWKSTDIAAWLIAQSEQAAQREADLAAPLKRKADRAAQKSALARRQQKAQEVGHAHA